MQIPSLNEYYLWRKNTEVRYPWLRQYLNLQFLNYEQKRIKELSEWYKIFNKLEISQKLEEVSFYSVPLELSSSWKASIAESGNYNYVGLSGLYNSPNYLLIGLLPNTSKQPEEYRLIQIINSTKTYLIDKKSNKVEPAIIIEDWDYLPSDLIYLDIPYEKNIIQNIINETLINDDQISLSFQSPVISAPYIDGSIGGISLSSIAGGSTFAKELIKTIQLLVPPEYRFQLPPKKVFNGTKFQYMNGMKFHLAERPFYDKNVLSSFYSKQYSRIYNEITKRNNFNGEFSIFSTINPDEGNLTQMWKELLKNFTATDITLPCDLDELRESDVYLKPLKNAINEDIWIQVVNSRQFEPSLNLTTDNDFIKITNLLKEDFDALLSDIHKQEESREYIVRTMLNPCSYNLKRIAQSIARSEENNDLNYTHLKKARDLIIDNLTGFVEHPHLGRIVSRIETKKENARYSIVQTEIINNPHSSTNEIYNAVESTKLYKDIYDLQQFLDWLHRKGYVIIDQNKRYVWVGK